MTVPDQIVPLLERMYNGDATAMGYTLEELDEKRYSVPDDRPRAAPLPIIIPSFMKTPVYEQSGGTCVGNATAAGLTHSIFQATGEVVVFDGEALNARVTHKFEEATSFRPIMDDLMKSGVAPLSDEGLYFPQGYANIDYKDIEAIKQAVATPGQVCLMATECTPEFGDGRRAKEFLPARPDLSGFGLHAMFGPVACTNEGVIVQNNYSVRWGDGGHCRFSWDYVLRHFVEIMVITMDPNVAGGYIRTHKYGPDVETAFKHIDLPDRKRPATYLSRSNGRIWITDPIQAKRYGVRLPAVAVPDTDPRWALPVIGQDAPKQFR